VNRGLTSWFNIVSSDEVVSQVHPRHRIRAGSCSFSLDSGHDRELRRSVWLSISLAITYKTIAANGEKSFDPGRYSSATSLPCILPLLDFPAFRQSNTCNAITISNLHIIKISQCLRVDAYTIR
jgi:hypothetical protein